MFRQQYLELEAAHQESKSKYDKVAVGLEVDKQTLEKECDTLQVCYDKFVVRLLCYRKIAYG